MVCLGNSARFVNRRIKRHNQECVMISRMLSLIVACAFACVSAFAQSGEDTKASGAAPASVETTVNKNPLPIVSTYYMSSGARTGVDIRISPIPNAEGVPKAKLYMGGATWIRCLYGEKEVTAREEGDKFILQTEGGYPANLSGNESYCRGLTVKVTLPRGGGLSVIDFTSTEGGGSRATFRY